MWRSGAWLGRWLCLLWALVVPDAQAARSFRLQLAPRFLTADQLPALAAFLREVERAVPPRVQAQLPQTFVVAFDHDPEEHLAPDISHPLRLPQCPSQAAATPRTLSLPAQELALLELSDDASSPHQIHLHRGFAAIILAGPQAAPRYPCGHGSLYRLALATVLHEVVHAFDARAGLSRDPRYRHLVRFDRQGIWRQLRPRNQLWTRSPDPYEGHSLPESLAVNAEYFLLDPEYRCRRPASYAFFEEALRYRPHPQTACAQNYTVYHRGEALSLDPARIYQIHYLLAARGDGIASRFGHSMFRLVVCNESRTQVGPECMEDVQDHVVLGFGANLQSDLQISPWKGLTGGYVSQLFVKPLASVLIEYTERELRGLDSLPLRLSQEEQRQFVRRALEIYWSYAGRYYFLSNNCASESLSLLQSASADPQLHRIHTITPSGLFDELLRRGLAQLPPVPSGAATELWRERAGLYFPSQAGRYEAAFAVLRPHLPPVAPTTLKRYLSHSDARQREVWLAGLSTLPLSLAQPVIAQAFALEGLILQRRLVDAERTLTRFILQNLHRPHLQTLQALLPQLAVELPWQFVAPGYGIPFAAEVRRPPDREHDRVAQELWREAQGLLQTYFPAEYGEWHKTQENRRRLIEQLMWAASHEPERTPASTAQAQLTATAKNP